MKQIIPQRIRVRRLSSIQEISAREWDGLTEEPRQLHSHHFLSVIEQAKIEDSELYYLLFYRGEQLLATAVVSAFTVNLALFLDGTALTILQQIRRVFPQFLKIKMLIGGTPLSLGQHHIQIRPGVPSRAILALMATEMNRLAQEKGIQQLCIKEFLASEMDTFQSLTDWGYFPGYSIPYVHLSLPWNNFPDYLATLRHPYRRKIKRSLKKIGMETPRIRHSSEFDSEALLPQLVIGGPEVCDASTFHHLYLRVMERAETKLETLNETFFQKLFEELPKTMQLLALKKQQEISGVALIMQEGTTMTFLLVGKPAHQDRTYDTYFNLVYGIMQIAMERQCTHLKLGQTAYHVKQRIGGVLEEQYLFFRSRNRWTHWVLSRLNSLIFPKMELPSYRVFKQTLPNQK